MNANIVATPLTSRKNPIVRLVCSLHDRKIRNNEKKFFVEGVRFCNELFSTPDNILLMIFTDDFIVTESGGKLAIKALSLDIHVYRVPRPLMATMSGLKESPGVLALVQQRVNISFIQRDNQKRICLLYADRIQDPGNLGNLLRTVDALGADGLVTSRGGVDIYHPAAVRGSAGAVIRKPVYCVRDLKEWVQLAHRAGLKIIMAHSEAGKRLEDISPGPKYSIVVGTEGIGLKQEHLALADEVVWIPMSKGVESLNVTTAAAIVLYELLRKK